MNHEKIYFITDSSCDISAAEAAEYDIHILPVKISYGGKTMNEFYDIDPIAFYDALSDMEEIPSTAQVTPTRYIDEYTAARNQGCSHVIGAFINAAGSGTYSSACAARQLFYDEFGDDMLIDLIDSRLYTSLYGYPLLVAARLAREGLSFTAVDAALRELLDRAEASFIVYDMKHLRKSGRISGAAAFVGGALGLRPILKCGDSECKVIDKIRGSRALVEKILAVMQENIDLFYEHQRFMVIRGKVLDEEYQRMLELLDREYPQIGKSFFQLGPSVSINAGPHLLAIGYFSKPHGSVPPAFML